MAGQSDDLSSLMSYVNHTLTSTDQVRKVLQFECDEANFALRPWIIESVFIRDIDDNYCSCVSEVDSDKHIEEIANGIDKALAQTQQLRHKVAKNILDSKRHNEMKNVQKIYTSATKSTKFNNFDKKETSRSFSDPSTSITNAKIPKNFIAVNKSSVKAISQKNAQISKKQKLHEDNQEIMMKRKKSFPSIDELDSLIKKVSLDTIMKKTSLSTVEFLKNDCPHYDDDIKKTVTERKQTTIDVVDGLEKFGIPENLLSVLKVYHLYLADSANEDTNVKNRKSAKKFLNNYQKFNEKRLTAFGSNDMVTLIQEFPKLYRDLHNKNLNTEVLSKMKIKYNELDKLCKKCGIKKYDTLKNKRTGINVNLNSECISNGWLSNGIWNWTNSQYFSHLTNILCIQYTNKNQLLSLFDVNQRLQRTIHWNNLLDILLHEIIPMIKNKFDPTTKEYVEMYKMVFIIAQILNPRLPVLVKTDE